MKKNIIYFLLTYFYFFSKSKGNIINHSAYNLITNNKYLNYFKNKLQISSSKKYEAKSNFRITISHDSLYNIEHIKTNLILVANPPELKLAKKT